MPQLGNVNRLTSKEWAITALVFQGSTDAQIASKTHTQKRELEDRLRKILAKTGCWNRTEVALWYMKLGVEKERRADDRREAKRKISSERRQVDRRHPPQRSHRADERHEINVNE